MFHRPQPLLRRTKTFLPPRSAPDDGKDHRIQQVATTRGTTTTATYIDALEELTTIGSTATTTAPYGGLAHAVTGPLSFTLSDTLGSVTVALDGSGAVTAAQFSAPYGGALQQRDAGLFTSADAVASDRSPYTYVCGNPETLTDPTGHRYTCPDGGCGGGGGNGAPPQPAIWEAGTAVEEKELAFLDGSVAPAKKRRDKIGLTSKGKDARWMVVID